MRKPAWQRLVPAAAAVLLATLGAVALGTPPAAAAVPDRLGFVLWNGGAVVPTGTTPAATTVTLIGVGRYQVKFPGQGIAGGVVHVTAINAVAHWCQAEQWFPSGVDEIAYIRCYKAGGVLDYTAFSAIFYRSSGPSPYGTYGYVDANPGGGTISQYNAAGAVNTVTHVGVGKWQVKFPGIGTAGPKDGSLQATAVNSATGARCNIANLASTPAQQDVFVYCFASAGAPLDTRFTLTYQYRPSLYGRAFAPKYYGYYHWVPGAGPASTNFNSQLGFGANTPAVAGVGLVTIKFPSIAFLPDTLQVSTFGTVPNWCSLSAPWQHFGTDTVAQNVNCFTVNGTPVHYGFFASANSLQ
ncbi:hypothetical protein F4553_002569 [Allocatelliglobosispora scoriae]|uniref:Uncharacterized protein n=1 Tax=Allocatelliglobosispora scoriae TaxID=643052 RepID=A0A841BQU9_9ACTN|nr:hypothetical protein [Allocatelliglobosispora scoriae]MBB5869190.1 hypothetical protein [Allocatelliglobosispora scoriae]